MIEADLWADLESPLDPVPEFFVDAPDSDAASELQRQVAFRRKCRDELPHVLLVAVPNAAKRGQKGLNQARSEGAVWGFPDMMAIGQRKIAFLEFKSSKTRPAKHQIDVMNRLQRLGFAVGVFRRADSAVEWLKRQGF